jgi:hypothetical protein
VRYLGRTEVEVDDGRGTVVPEPAKPTRKRSHRYYTFWRFVTAGLLLLIAWDVRRPGNVAWDDDAWWPLFAAIGVVYGLAGVRSLALWVREREAADTGEGTA